MKVTRSSNPVPPDRAQRERIITELDRNMFVEAAAGTGKTASMVERMIALLATGRCRDVRNLAAVTFTRKAAAELCARFRVRLERAVRHATGPESERLERALRHMEQAYVGTIHSFCARLLRERPVEAGVDLAFEEIDEETDSRLRRLAWEELIGEFLAEDAGGLHAELSRLGLRIEDLEEAFVRFADYPDVEAWPAPDSGSLEVDLGAARKELEQYVTHMRSLAPRLPEREGSDGLIRDFRRLPRIVSHYPDLADPVQLMEVLELFDRKCRVRPTVWASGDGLGREDAQREEARWEQFRSEVVRPCLCAWYEHRYSIVLKVLVRARAHYDRLRGRNGQLNFQDLLMRAARLLRDNPHVRAYFQQRYRFLLVDEFQDTDPVQAEVLLLLTSTDLKETDWRKCSPRPGSLFVVGDPKQSIYRFRRADIVTYNEVKEIIRKGRGEGGKGVVLHLSTNFRTVPRIIEWVNRVFGPPGSGPETTQQDSLRFPRQGTEASPGYVPLQAGRADAEPGVFSGVYRLSIPEGYTRGEDMVAYEADRIARTIRYAIDTRMTVPRTSRELEEGRSERVGPDDFMIVTFRRYHLSRYAHTLQEYGIPHRVTGGAVLNKGPELRLLYLCVKAVLEPDNPVALVAALRSELFGMSDAALYAFKRAGGRFSYREGVPPGLQADEAEAFRDAFSRLARYAQWLGRLPMAAGLERIITDLGLMALASVRPGGDMHAGSLGKAVEMIRKAQSDFGTSDELVQYLGALVSDEEPHDGIPAGAGEEPAVRIMNLHKVKGLEAPVVFLADPTGMREHPVGLHIDRTARRILGYIAVYGENRGWAQGPMLAQPVGWEALAEREKVFLAAESVRLRYVAATRAGSALVVTCRPQGRNQQRSPWAGFSPFLADAPEIPDPGPVERPEPTAGRILEPGQIDRAEQAIQDRRTAVKRPTHAAWAAKAYALSRPGPGRPGEEGTEAGQAVAGEPGPPWEELTEQGEHGVEWGEVVHMLLKASMENPGADLLAMAGAALAEHGLDPGRAQAAVDEVRSVMRSGIWRRALASQRRLVEVPFEVLMEEAGSTMPTLVRGAIDLLFEEPGGWVLVDYKTDRPEGRDPGSLVGRYAPQVRLYASAWEKITGEPVKEKGLYFLKTGRFEPVTG